MCQENYFQMKYEACDKDLGTDMTLDRYEAGYFFQNYELCPNGVQSLLQFLEVCNTHRSSHQIHISYQDVWPRKPTIPPPSDNGSYQGSSDGSDGPTQPRYTPEELGALFVDFYSFLTTLHYNKSDLKIPPPTGWPQITPESCGHYKADYAILALRHPPYFNCEIFEDFHAGDMLDAVPIETFFDNLKEQYKTLKLIPGRKRITIEAEKFPEHDGRITEEAVNTQAEEWGTDLDIQYIRQVYRDYGWPESFRFQEASNVIDGWLTPLGGGVRGGPRGLAWQQSPPDWDSTRWT
ncbi:hypothetical protein F52700_2597 [Fusarium sp. NRRL 52700]|nr:hypothetical protein F52700_2597 [Fusarium sp. NRRL 52700]